MSIVMSLPDFTRDALINTASEQTRLNARTPSQCRALGPLKAMSPAGALRAVQISYLQASSHTLQLLSQIVPRNRRGAACHSADPKWV